MKEPHPIPPCPKCGQVYEVGSLEAAGWQRVTITRSVLFTDDFKGGEVFCGEEFECATCRHTWRVAEGEKK